MGDNLPTIDLGEISPTIKINNSMDIYENSIEGTRSGYYDITNLDSENNSLGDVNISEQFVKYPF